MGIRINGSSGGYVEIGVPANPSNRNVTLPDFDGEAVVSRGTSGATGVAFGTTADRSNVTPTAGDIRFNTDTGQMEYWSTTSDTPQWRSIDKGPLNFNVRYLVVAGGGSGGSCEYSYVAAGGGGAGGYLTATTTNVSPNTAYTVTVGTGGARQTTNRVQGNAGGNSVFSSFTAIGGGGGGAAQMSYYNVANAHGGNGGSGGGVGGYAQHNGGANVGTGTAGQGNNGGGPSGNDKYGGGGGGGAGGAGGDASDVVILNGTPGDGGAGLSNDITGSSITYAGGGSGGQFTSNNNTIGLGGSGVGGRGARRQSAGQYASRVGQTPGSGGGGGGGYDAVPDEIDGGAGADGIVILRIPNTHTATFSSGLTVSTGTAGTDNVYQVTAGTGTVTFTEV